MSRPQGHGTVGRKYVTEKSSDTTGNRSRDRPTSSAAPLPLRHLYFYEIIVPKLVTIKIIKDARYMYHNIKMKIIKCYSRVLILVHIINIKPKITLLIFLKNTNHTRKK